MKYAQVLLSRAANGFMIVGVGTKKDDSETYVASDVDEAMVITRQLLEEHEDTTVRDPKRDPTPWGSNFGPSSFS